MLGRGHGCFVPTLTDDETIFPLAAKKDRNCIDEVVSPSDEEAMNKYVVVGRFLGMAVRCGYTIKTRLSKAVYAALVSKPVWLDAVNYIDSALDNQLVQIRKNRILKDDGFTFTVESKLLVEEPIELSTMAATWQ